ncbi:FHA domain protein (macronuclear) [Tetrahymena thermophila SB210]|uniref:FHA domain protein n=1 Tax=Tetrahymena thermophila (strain SB210) TaxID=312017 RepID=I7MFG8_TETTS|nr:FHA domain protein [Tetrahymena thermophila SB210]EAR83937.2 FHA domain protein [Tetrahymena thermophila SB210]|eukprot:XP_001031600.2 FHA domain protein [Tetrahymena thermophila SB210]
MNIFGTLKQTNGQIYQLSKKINIIGRANSCHIIVKHASASKEHCLIEFDEKNSAFLKDLESLNGTYLNDQRLKNGQSVQIFDQDVIQVGQDQNKFIFFQSKANQAALQQKSQNIGEQVLRDEIPRKDKDFKISVVDYSFRDNSFSKQPQQQQKKSYSVNQVGSSYNNNNNSNNLGSTQFANQSYQHIHQESQQLGNFTPNSYNIKQQKLDKLEGVKQELYNQNIDLNDKLLQREEQIIRLENEIKLLRNENDAVVEENDKLKAKQKALQLYSSELQKQIDLLNEEVKQKNIQFADLSEQDWTRKLQENNVEIKNLRQLLTQKDAEVQQLKKNISTYFQNTRDIQQNNTTLFLEHQAKELAACKKQVLEYENRNNECSRRWTSLLQENSDKDDKIKGLKLQLSRQIETMQTLYSDFDRKINEYNTKLQRVFDEHEDIGDKQRDAAEFLVQQVAFMQEERKNLAVENENLHTQIQELISEVEKMKQELENYAVLFDVSVMDLSSNKANQGNIISKLKNRIDEFEDLINETKQKESVGKLIELQDLFEEIEKKLDRERIINDELNKQLKTLQLTNKSESINEQNCIDFFSNLLDEKDKKIQILANQVEQFQMKEKQYNERIEDLNNNLMLTNKNFNEYKNKNERMAEIMQQNRQAGSSITAQFGVQNYPQNIISNERVQEKLQSDARIYKASYNDYE